MAGVLKLDMIVLNSHSTSNSPQSLSSLSLPPSLPPGRSANYTTCLDNSRTLSSRLYCFTLDDFTPVEVSIFFSLRGLDYIHRQTCYTNKNVLEFDKLGDFISLFDRGIGVFQTILLSR